MAGSAGSAIESGSKSLRELTDKLDEYVEKSPEAVNVACFLGGVAVIVNGILGVLDVFDVFDEPIYYLVNAYMVFFGAVTCITETRPTFAGQLHDVLQGVQRWMHEWCRGLTLIWGRGLFYIFQGTFCLLSSGLLSLGLLIGLYLMLVGLICLKEGYKKNFGSATRDYIRVA
mmetsp:Transcript_58709/g.109928  ORF Transcript_58709/g.109928 Transcript_58709/m.109928 type:complete len:172 (-) Transcript_58709:44-559(-)